MAKEWILNQAMNRWGLNKKKCVGAVSEEIRKCSPHQVQEWEGYYYQNVCTSEKLEELGRKLYVKISEVVQHEVDDVTEQDCIDYMKDVVIRRTFDGYQTEIRTIYGELEQALGVRIEPAPDEWDRLYNVDFYINAADKFIGLQIKPVSFQTTYEHHKWEEMQETSHRKFEAKFGGKVFMVFSVTKDKKKSIANPEVVQAIKAEIARLSH